MNTATWEQLTVYQLNMLLNSFKRIINRFVGSQVQGNLFYKKIQQENKYIYYLC